MVAPCSSPLLVRLVVLQLALSAGSASPQDISTNGFEGDCTANDSNCPLLRSAYWETWQDSPDANGTECTDGLDNDNDELIDSLDPGCMSPCDSSEDLEVTGNRVTCLSGDNVPVTDPETGDIVECMFDGDGGMGNDPDCAPAPGSDCWGCWNGYNSFLGEFCEPDHACWNNGCAVCNTLANPDCVESCISCQEACDGIDNNCDGTIDERCST